MKIDLKDLIGKVYGNLTIIEAKRNERYVIIVKAKCSCDGNIKEYQYQQLKNGRIKSCGCYRNQIIKKHGATKTKLYKIWCCIKDRCYNEKSRVFNKYGGRGIKMCEEWYKDFISFKEWSLVNGYKENSGLSIVLMLMGIILQIIVVGLLCKFKLITNEIIVILQLIMKQKL